MPPGANEPRNSSRGVLGGSAASCCTSGVDGDTGCSLEQPAIVNSASSVIIFCESDTRVHPLLEAMRNVRHLTTMRKDLERLSVATAARHKSPRSAPIQRNPKPRHSNIAQLV